MEWIPDAGWFTHLELNTEAHNLTYDLSVGVGEVTPSLVDAGLDLNPGVMEDMHGAEPAQPTKVEVDPTLASDVAVDVTPVSDAAIGAHSHDPQSDSGLNIIELLTVTFVALLAAGLGATLAFNGSLARRLQPVATD